MGKHKHQVSLFLFLLKFLVPEGSIIFFESLSTPEAQTTPAVSIVVPCLRVENCPSLQDISNEELSKTRPCRFEGNVALYPCPEPSSTSTSTTSTVPPPAPRSGNIDGGGSCSRCLLGTDCPQTKLLLDEKRFAELKTNFNLCGFSQRVPKFCCPAPDEALRNAGSEEQDIESEYQLRDINLDGSSLSSSEKQEVSFEEETCGFSAPTRIRNGNDAGPHEHPWNVALLYKNESMSRVLCGGVLISPTEALTAAHCVRDFKGFLLSGILLGHADVKEAREVNLTGVTLHPSYSRTPFIRNDIAILHFDPVAIDEEGVKLICMPSAAFSQEDSQGVVSGWGVTDETLFSENLQRLDVEIVPSEDCDGTYRAKHSGFALQESQICASGLKEDSDSCSGDSGSPLLYYEPVEGRAVLLGITSFGTRKCDSSVPGVYTRVVSHIPWLRVAIGHARAILSQE